MYSAVEDAVSNMNRRIRGAILMATIIMVANGLGAYSAVRWNTNAPLGLAVGATAVVAFVGMLSLCQASTGPWKVSDGAMRIAIASSILAQYQALVAMVAFVSRSPDSSPISQSLIANFTSIVGVVVAFYFGASAYVEGRRIAAGKEEDDAVARRTPGGVAGDGHPREGRVEA